jgi:hypothetical protein
MTEIQDYMLGVRTRAGHHAPNVRLIVPALVGFALERADPGSIEYRRRNGELGNVSWIKVRGRRYAFSYSHDSQAIQLRRGSLQGPVLFEFDNDTPLADVAAAFATL